jgi:zinc protease
VEEKKVTDAADLFQYNSEIAGQYMLSVTAFQKTNLNDVMNGINEAFKTLKPKGFHNKI